MKYVTKQYNNEFTESQILKYYETTLGFELPKNGWSGWSNFACPLHSCSSVNFGIKLETGGYNCLAGCGGGSIYDFEMALTECDFQTAKETVWGIINGELGRDGVPKKPTPKPVVHTNGGVREDLSLYEDPEGRYVYAIERLRMPDGSKVFLPTHKKKDKLIHKLPSTTYLYHLPEVIRAKTVFVVEGEKCCDVLRNALGHTLLETIAVTTNPNGAGSWKEDYDQYLKGKDVYLVPDNDDAGRKHIHKIAKSIRKVVNSLKVMDVPGDEGSDIADYIQEFDNHDDALKGFLHLISSSKPYKPHSRAQLLRFSEMERKEIDWLWWPYIPLGNITFMDAEPGTGKTTMSCAIAAKVTTGDLFPVGDNTYTKQGGVIYLTAEDSYESTILPRFEDCGGDKNFMYGIDCKLKGEEGNEKEFPITLQDLDELEDAIIEVKPRLIIIDPIQAYLGDDVNMNLASDVRPVLAGLKRLVEKYNVAAVCIRHLNKDTKMMATHRGMGSIDFLAAARSVVLLGKNPDNPDDRAMIHIKHNLSKKGDSVGYRISENEYNKTLQFEWTGISQLTEETVSAKPADQGALEDAMDFLSTALTKGPLDSGLLRKVAKEEHEISSSTLRRAADKLGIKKTPTDAGKQKYEWSLPNSI